jgi:Tn3 transposase DDE domain-containing protein
MSTAHWLTTAKIGTFGQDRRQQSRLVGCRIAGAQVGEAVGKARDEQRKMIKYNHLVANLLIFHTVVGMTRALDIFATEGYGPAIAAEALAGTSPYLTEHLNRFGSYVLDLSTPPPPLPFMFSTRARPPSPITSSAAVV